LLTLLRSTGERRLLAGRRKNANISQLGRVDESTPAA
jgi:hypothetical protein